MSTLIKIFLTIIETVFDVEKYMKLRADSGVTYLGLSTFGGRTSSHRCLKIPSQSWTPTIPNMKKTKKHNSRTFPNIGKVSRRSITRIRMPVKEIININKMLIKYNQLLRVYDNIPNIYKYFRIDG